MANYRKNAFEEFRSVIQDKRVSLWFWVFTVLYFMSGIAVLYYFGWLSTAATRNVAHVIGFLLLFPYLILSGIYLAYALSKPE